MNLLKIMKLAILFLMTILTLRVIPFVPLNGLDSFHIALAILMVHSLFEIYAPSYTVLILDKNKRIIRTKSN